MAGSWIGCDDNFIRLDGGLGEGGHAARPIWEYFFAKVLADKNLGINKQAKFVQPENMKTDAMYDYMNIIDKTPPPGAEGQDQGNGNANQYLDTSSPKVPVDSKLSGEEEKVLQEATTIQKSDNQGSVTITVKDADKNPPPKKKKGFFNKLFGKDK